MNVSTSRAAADSRAAAARIIAEVIGAARHLDRVMDEALEHQPALHHQAAMIQEMCYGTARWFHQLDGIARALLHQPVRTRDVDVRSLLLVGLYQLRYMSIPSHAAVAETVEAAATLGKPWSKNLLNACLRAYLRRRDSLEDLVAREPVLRWSHPAWLLERLQEAYPDSWQSIAAANNARPPLALRVNLLRVTRAEYLARLRAAGIDATAATLADSDVDPAAALWITRPVPVSELPGFDDGLVSVQDVAAQLAAPLLDAPAGGRVLDACAAPGGKTAHILEHTPNIGELVALDAQPRRVALIADTLARLRLTATVRNADAADPPTWWDGEPFDRILADVPCSATGVVRRHPDVKLRRRPEDLTRLVATQARLLDGLWPMLQRGGKLLYASCSVLPEENQHRVAAFLARHPDAVEVALPRLPGIGCTHGRQIRPGDGTGADGGVCAGLDGFYYACLHKT